MNSYYSHRMTMAGLDITRMSTEDLQSIVDKLFRGKIHGISFSPYVAGQGPGTILTEDQIRERLAIVEPYVNWIRTFSCTEGNEIIPEIAHEHGLKTMVGVWLGEDLDKNEEELAGAIRVAHAGHADILGVGNEVLLRGDLTEEQLVEYLERAKIGRAHV